MNKIIKVIFPAVFICANAYAGDQKATPKHASRNDIASFGLGTGLEFGATIGARFAIFPDPHIGCTLGAGFTTSMITYNVGLKLRPVPQYILSPFLSALYGHNYVEKTRFYYTDRIVSSRGVSIGGGIDINLTNNHAIYVTIGADYALTPALAYVKGGISFALGN